MPTASSRRPVGFRTVIAATALAGVIAVSAAAGPVIDFENTLDTAYADYRMALVLTNQKNVDGTMKAISGFEAKWATLAATYAKAPPPQYAEDQTFAAVLAKIAEINQRAKQMAADGKLAESHEVLEEIRHELGELRLRNGIMRFSDRMNEFHARMEIVVVKSYDGFSAAGLAELREDAAVLVVLADDLKRHPPASAASPEFAPLLQALLDTVRALQSAARTGDGSAGKVALGKIKPAYSRLFAKFG
jgi:hypothetical protein